MGLLPITRRVWAPRGTRPAAPVDRHYQWLYVYGFVRPATGQSWWALVPTVSTAAMGAVLAAFARDEDIDATHRWCWMGPAGIPAPASWSRRALT